VFDFTIDTPQKVLVICFHSSHLLGFINTKAVVRAAVACEYLFNQQWRRRGMRTMEKEENMMVQL
jgi:hypothetical protein